MLDRVGSGGQGVIYKVRDIRGVPTETEQAMALKKGLRAIENEIQKADLNADAFLPVIKAIQNIASSESSTIAALKVLLPFEQAVAASEQTALARMKNEIDVLGSVRHPALIRIFDSNLDERWFAMEYFANGPLSDRLTRFRAHVLESLKALRPIVQAVSLLHQKNIVHRDIKPDNIFIAEDGRLVLGDCGLAIKLENQERLTLTFDNVGTREYQPPWTYGLRVEEVRPNFDVFSLAKVLWAMISGKPRFPLEDFAIEPHDLRKQFPDDPDIAYVHRLLSMCIVRREVQCSVSNAGALLQEVDLAIRAIQSGAQLPGEKRTLRCRFCGIGFYEKLNAPTLNEYGHSEPGRAYACDQCGHVEQFVLRTQRVRDTWSEN